MDFSISLATEENAPVITELRNSVALQLTGIHGNGHWSSCVKETSVLRNIKTSRVLLAKSDGNFVGTLRFDTKKPWAIDLAYFTRVERAVYLHDMAVLPSVQGKGLGRKLIAESVGFARSLSFEAIRLDAYDSPAGAGPFYAKCGFSEVGRVVYRKVPLTYFEMLLTT